MNYKLILSLSGALLLGSGSQVWAAAVPAWYDITFTGVDIWTYSADNAGQARTDQAAPRRYRDWTQDNVVRDTTYGLNGGLPTTGFGAWAPGSGFAFDEINLWGKGGTAAAAWGENYTAVPDDYHNGVTSWRVIQAPAGWTDGIVLGNQSYNQGSGAYPVWRSGTGDTLGIANMKDPNFKFEFQVLISNPDTAFDPDGKLRVWFGGFRDDLQNTGPDNYEVSGIMSLNASKVPDGGASLAMLGLALAGLAELRRRWAN